MLPLLPIGGRVETNVPSSQVCQILRFPPNFNLIAVNIKPLPCCNEVVLNGTWWYNFKTFYI